MADAVARRTVAYLLTEREPPGVWRYYGRAGAQTLSPDVDDTSVAWAALQTQGLDVDAAALDALWTSRGPTGLFNTWIGDPATWVGVDNRDVDLVVNLNALLLFSLVGKPVDAVCRRAVESARTGAFVQGTIYYASPLAFTYALSRAHADGGAGCLDGAIPPALEMVLRTQQENGSWESDLDTALGLLTLLNGHYRGEALQRGICVLIARQAPDGGWGLGRAYRGAAIPVNYGSRSLTTGLCLEALGKYLRGLTAAVSQARMTREAPGAHFGHREHPDRSMVNAQIGAW